jgi:hypothetical protein
MEPQVSHPKLPMILAIGITAIVFGLGGYMIANMSTTDSDDTATTSSTTTTSTTPTASPTTKATATTSTVDTKDWKTYTSSKYKFSIKYPSDWNTSGKLEAFETDKNAITFYKGSDKTKGLRLVMDVASGRGGVVAETYYDTTYSNGKMTVDNKTEGKAVYFGEELVQPYENTISFKTSNLLKLANFQTGEGIENIGIEASNVQSTEDENTIVAIVSSIKFN